MKHDEEERKERQMREEMKPCERRSCSDGLLPLLVEAVALLGVPDRTLVPPVVLRRGSVVADEERLENGVLAPEDVPARCAREDRADISNQDSHAGVKAGRTS